VQSSDQDLDSTFEPWSIKRTAILSNYTTSEKLSITTVSHCNGNNSYKCDIVL